MGHLVEAMAEAGIDTSSVSMIALTHAHGDHINGLLCLTVDEHLMA